jgi:hypothetical protein
LCREAAARGEYATDFRPISVDDWNEALSVMKQAVDSVGFERDAVVIMVLDGMEVR